MRRLPLVHALGAVLVDHALGVAEDDVFGCKTHRLDEFDAGNRRGSRAVADELGGLEIAARQMQRIDEAGCGDDRRAMLVVMEDRDVHDLAQALLDDEALGRLDILEIDAAEGGAEKAHAIDEFVRILGIDFEVDGIDVGETLEEDGLAFHHGLGGECAEIAETENGGAVGNHRHHVATRGVIECAARIFSDRLDRHGHTRRIGQREIALGCHRLGGRNLEFTGPSARMKIERFLIGDSRRTRGGLVGPWHSVFPSLVGDRGERLSWCLVGIDPNGDPSLGCLARAVKPINQQTSDVP